MNLENLNLKSPPIVEAVLDIECDLPPDLVFSTLEKPARDRFSDYYPVARSQFVQEHQIGLKPNEHPSVSIRHTVQSFQFLQSNEKQLVQVRTQGFSFNRLAPYTNLDDYLPEIERTWQIYVELANPVQIRLVRLRYINRIELPMSTGLVQLDDYFKVTPHLPEEERLSLVGFFNQHAAVENETGNLVNIVLTAQPLSEQKLPIIFDTTVASSMGGETNDWLLIREKILELRNLKNRIFRNTLTDKCLKLFR
ncbi:MAG: TIGR04255 family protein [Methylococcales bacterium]